MTMRGSQGGRAAIAHLKHLVRGGHQDRALRQGIAVRRMSRRIPIPVADHRTRHIVGMLTLVGALASPIAVEATTQVTVHLRHAGHSRAHGTAVARTRGRGTRVVFSLYGLPPRAHVRAVLNAGTCRRPSASFSTIGGATAGSAGRAHWSAPVLFHGTPGMPVSLRTITDGPHIFRVFGRFGDVACGAVPSRPTHHTGKH